MAPAFPSSIAIPFPIPRDVPVTTHPHPFILFEDQGAGCDSDDDADDDDDDDDDGWILMWRKECATWIWHKLVNANNGNRILCTKTLVTLALHMLKFGWRRND